MGERPNRLADMEAAAPGAARSCVFSAGSSGGAASRRLSQSDAQRRYELLVFDWDGTVMDSVARIVACLHGATVELGLEPHAEPVFRDVIGLGLREAIEALFPGRDDAFHAAFVASYRRRFLEHDPTPSRLFPSAVDVLEALREEGYLLAVATGKGREGLARALDETGLGGVFDATRCADETCSKPHPQMLLELMDELQVAPADTLMIGDTEYDLEMAGHAGASGLAVSYGVHTRERLLRHRPVGCIDRLADLPGWLLAATPGLSASG
jgi:phosphoglycolate phosphatase